MVYSGVSVFDGSPVALKFYKPGGDYETALQRERTVLDRFSDQVVLTLVLLTFKNSTIILNFENLKNVGELVNISNCDEFSVDENCDK